MNLTPTITLAMHGGGAVLLAGVVIVLLALFVRDTRKP